MSDINNKNNKNKRKLEQLIYINSNKRQNNSSKNFDSESDEEDEEYEEDEREEDLYIYQKEKEEIIVPEHLKKIENLDQLIELGLLYDTKKIWKGSICLRRLHKLVPSLEKLKKMIGMEILKKSIVDFIIFYLQDLDGGKNKDLMHTVLEGPPGCGKTEIGKILADIYLGMEIISRNYFRIVKRHDLIGQYLGQTAPRTQKVIDECLGGVMFIDEAYSLGNPEGRDTFSKECLDTLNQNLTENKHRFICIIAGYKDALKNSFFQMNQGLESRFPIRFEVDTYQGKDLFLIFKKIVKEQNWNFDKEEELNDTFFVKNEKEFSYYGRDMEVLFQKTKIAHSKRIYNLPPENKKKINLKDIEEGFILYQKMTKDRKNKEDQPPLGMYM